MRATRLENTVKFLTVGFLAVSAVGCATTTTASNADRGLGPTLSVERFLNAANTRDHESMMRLFGTAQGPIGDTGTTAGCAFKRMGSWIRLSDRCESRPDVELRMDMIARLIRHEDYNIRSEEMVAGRNNPTTQISVDLDIGNRRVSGVPFVLVKAGDGSWLIQEIGLARITS